MLLDRNLASVVRDAPYAVDHLSARSQRPIISRDTCACPDKKRYVSRWKRSWKKLFHRDRENSGVARYGTGARDTDNNDDGQLVSLSSIEYRFNLVTEST